MTDNIKDIMTTEEAATFLRLSPGTLDNWRALKSKKGPAFYKPNGKVYYLKADLEAWVASGRQDEQSL